LDQHFEMYRKHLVPIKCFNGKKQEEFKTHSKVGDLQLEPSFCTATKWSARETSFKRMHKVEK